MNKLFIETKYLGEIKLPKSLIEELPEKVVVCTTVQFLDFVKEIKHKLEAYHKKVYLFQSRHGRQPGQILGCDRFKVRGEIDAFLYIGDGEFHPRALLVNEKPVFCYNPLSGEVKKLGRKEWEELALKKKVGLMKFHSANKIGIIISTKPGQKEMQGKARELKQKLESQNKQVFLFQTDELKEEELVNFNFIDCWVNTACPRIEIKGMVNLKEL